MTTPLRPQTADLVRRAEKITDEFPHSQHAEWARGVLDYRAAIEAEAVPDLRAALGRLIGRHHRQMLVNRDHCGACSDYHPTFDEVAALAAPAADGLDVERLARALDVIWVDNPEATPLYRDDLRMWRRKIAQRVIADYLHEPSREPGEEG